MIDLLRRLFRPAPLRLVLPEPKKRRPPDPPKPAADRYSLRAVLWRTGEPTEMRTIDPPPERVEFAVPNLPPAVLQLYEIHQEVHAYLLQYVRRGEAPVAVYLYEPEAKMILGR